MNIKINGIETVLFRKIIILLFLHELAEARSTKNNINNLKTVVKMQTNKYYLKSIFPASYRKKSVHLLKDSMQNTMLCS